MRAPERTHDTYRPARALVIGESLIDIIVDGDQTIEMPGGSPMNLSIGLTRQGIDVAFVTSFGADEHADTIEVRLVAEGVDVYSPERMGRTSTSVATVDEYGSPSYDLDIGWNLQYTAVPRGEADLVHFGSLGSVLHPGAQHVDELVNEFRSTALVSYDPNIRPSIDLDRAAARARVDRHAALSDIVKASEEDLAHIHPEYVTDHEPPSELARRSMINASIDRWLEAGCALVVITRGERGVELATRHHRLHLDSNRPAVVDTIGAGDAYMAGLLAGLDALGLLRGDKRDALAAVDVATLRSIGTWALLTAEVTVGRVGAEPPTSLELLKVREGAVA